MKKAQSLNKFKNYELKSDSIKLIFGGTWINTKFLNGTVMRDNFDDSSRFKSGGWPSKDLVESKPILAPTH